MLLRAKTMMMTKMRSSSWTCSRSSATTEPPITIHQQHQSLSSPVFEHVAVILSLIPMFPHCCVVRLPTLLTFCWVLSSLWFVHVCGVAVFVILTRLALSFPTYHPSDACSLHRFVFVLLPHPPAPIPPLFQLNCFQVVVLQRPRSRVCVHTRCTRAAITISSTTYLHNFGFQYTSLPILRSAIFRYEICLR